MNFLDVASLLIRESGSFAYHFILIITLGLSLALSRAVAPAVRGLRGGRWESALTSVLILRLALLFLFGAESLGLLRAPLALPALDRLAIFSSIVILTWGLLAPQGNRCRPGRGRSWRSGFQPAHADCTRRLPVLQPQLR